MRTVLPVTAAASARAAFGGDAWVLELLPGADPVLAAAQLATDPQVLYAGPNHLIAVTSIASNDSLFSLQYALESARVPEAWEHSDGSGVLIAIIDTGVELDHPDLVHQIAINETEANGVAGVDDDLNGFTDDVQGYDFTDVPGYPGTGDYLDRDPDATDDVGHGTQVAGVAAAERDNGIGIAGVAPGARILPVRAGFRTGLPFIAALLQEDDAAAAILYATDRGARILNLSFGDVVDAPLLRHAVRYARERGALVVASAGNTGQDHPFFPAAYPGVLVPGASTRQETRASFSTFGQDLDLLAPGAGLYTTDLDGTYRTATGTSFSAPMTAGAAALVWSVHPGWTADQVAWALRLASRREDSGWSAQVGWGLLDAAAAVVTTAEPSIVQIESHPPDGLEAGIRGTILDPELLEWSLSVLPESSSVDGSLEGERVLVQQSSLQLENDSLAVFTPPPGQEGFWVFRLLARTRDQGWIEERSRAFLPAAQVHAESVSVEVQAEERGWAVAAWWSSAERHQGALRLSAPGVVERFAMEPTLGTHHGVRLVDLFSTGERTLDILARPGETRPLVLLSRKQVILPPLMNDIASLREEDLPPGTPMSRVLEQGGVSQVFVESPPEDDVYGFVKQYEIGLGTVVERGSSEPAYRGIPIDAWDTDEDGKLELAVFRLDAWEIREATLLDGFPDALVHTETDTRPLRFLEEGLLVAAGSALRLLTPDGSGGFTVASEAESDGADLTAGAAVGDFDGDGLTEIACVNLGGDVALFELSGQSLRFETMLGGPMPFEPALSALPNGGHHDLLTVEREPGFPSVEGDLDRAATRVRLWQWTGSGYAPRSVLAFAGMTPPGRIQIQALDTDLVVRRDQRFDAVGTDGDSLVWKGRLHESELPRVDGFAVLAPPRLWIGTSSGLFSENLRLQAVPEIEDVAGSPLRVTSAVEISGGLDVTLAWEPDACDSAFSLRRGAHVLAITGRAARDTIPLGPSVTYELSATGCIERTLTVVGRPIERLEPLWKQSEIVFDFTVPLIDPLPEVLLRVGDRLESPRAVHLVHEGRELVVAPGKEPPDSVIVIGAWQADGLPLGGSVRSVALVPPYPGEDAPTVLADVTYDMAAHALVVTLGGDSLSCDPTFRLLPEDRSFTETHRAGTFEIDVGGPLAAGPHTLELLAPCLDAEVSSRSFRVGRAMYPNPVRTGQELVMEGLEPGTRIALVDVSGEERAAWRAAATVEVRPLGTLPPGLYFVRFEDPEGKLAGIEKLAVIR